VEQEQQDLEAPAKTDKEDRTRTKASAEQLAERDKMLETAMGIISEQPIINAPLEKPDPYWQGSDVCSCHQLARPLLQGERLLDHDHVCSKTIGLAGAEWSQTFQSSQESNVPLVIPFGTLFLRAVPGRRTWEDWPFLYISGPHDAQKGRPASAGTVLMVIRQWVEEEDKNLSRQILDSPAIKLYRQRMAADVKRDIGAHLTANDVEKFRTEWLPTLSLPSTPGTARFLLRELHGITDDTYPTKAPTRGVLVTSLLIFPPPTWPFNAAEPTERNKHLFQISGDALWDSMAARREAPSIVKEHQTWFEETAPGELLRYRSLPEGLGRTPPSDELNTDIEDLVAKRLSEADVLSRHFARLDEDSKERCGRPLNPIEKKSIRDAVRKRVARRLQAQNKQCRI
jgi:hypothetical protein